MKKDISFLPVEGVSIAIAREKNELNQDIWNVYILNRNDFVIMDVVIRSKGYGSGEGEQQQTSTLRHHIKGLDPHTHVLIEPIDPGVFHLYNEYWVSYFIKSQIFDKKFIFVPDSIVEENLIYIPQLKTKGVLHN
ncbi:MAG: hypothetical protein ACJ75J_01080 [Cytophagaceae bacterium]